MRASVLALSLAVALAVALALPRPTAAWVVVRAPVYYAPRPVYYAPPPVYVAPPPVYVAPPPPRPPAPLTTKLPMNTQLSELPSGCTSVSVKGELLPGLRAELVEGERFRALLRRGSRAAVGGVSQ